MNIINEVEPLSVQAASDRAVSRPSDPKTLLSTFRVGLVGAGYVSEFHIRALQRLPEVRIVGITDLDQARAQAVAARFKLDVYPSLDAMAEQGLDVVHVLTPPASHTAVTLNALRLGCHVYVEKPLASNVEDCDRIAAESAALGLEVCVGHSMLADPIFKRTVQAVRNGEIGNVLTAEILRSSVFPPYRGGPLPPQYIDGGYPFRDLGVHALYMLREILGPIDNVTAEFRDAGKLSSDPNLYFDEWQASVRCARGMGHITLSWNARPLQHILVVNGTRGTLRADLYSMFVTKRRQTPAPKAIERVANVFSESIGSLAGVTSGILKFAVGRTVPYQSLHTFVREFYQALAAGSPMPATVADAREIVEWTERPAHVADVAKQAARPPQVQPLAPAVVVTGANGLLGSALVRRLLSDGETVRLFVRREPSAELRQNPKVDFFLGELGDPLAVERGLANATGVYHCGAAISGDWSAFESGTIAGTQNVVDACLKHGIKKLVYVSSLSVLHRTAVADVVVNESAPLEPRAEERGAYTKSKSEAERIVLSAVREDHLNAIIVRPGNIWSEDRELLSASVGMRVGHRVVILGDPGLMLPLVHVDDVVSAMILAMEKDLPSGEIFHLVDDDNMSRKELAQMYIAAREPQLRIVHIPLFAVTTLAGVLNGATRALGRPIGPSPYRLRSGLVPLRCDCSKAVNELGWQPRVRSRTALRELLRPLN